MTEPDRTAAPSGHFLRRQAVLIFATTVLVAAGAGAYHSLAAATYTAHARVLVEPLTTAAQAQTPPDMGTEEAVATSGQVLANAAADLKLPLRAVTSAVGVTVPVDSDTLDIAYTSASPVGARRGAATVATAYVRYRARNPGGGNPRQAHVPALHAELITPPTVPSNESSPGLVVDVLAGLVVGLVAGSAIGLGRDRWGRRIRTEQQWRDMSGLPLLVSLRHDAITRSVPNGTDSAVALRHLRARLIHLLPPVGAALVVAPVGQQLEARSVATFLAGAVVESGRSAVMIELAAGPDTRSDPAVVGNLRSRVTQPCGPGLSSTRVGPWHTGTTAELEREVARYREAFGVVVLSTPPAVRSVVTLDAASLADATLLVDSTRTSRRAEVRTAVAELRSVGCPVLGCVLLGTRTSRVGDAVPSEPVARRVPRQSGPPTVPVSGLLETPRRHPRPHPRMRAIAAPSGPVAVHPASIAVVTAPHSTKGRAS